MHKGTPEEEDMMEPEYRMFDSNGNEVVIRTGRIEITAPLNISDYPPEVLEFGLKWIEEAQSDTDGDPFTPAEARGALRLLRYLSNAGCGTWEINTLVNGCGEVRDKYDGD